MAREKSIMELQDILRRLKAGHGIKQIHRETSTHRKVIRKVKTIALDNGWLDAATALPSEKELHDLYYGIAAPKQHPLDRLNEELTDYHKSGISYVVMHQLICDRVAVSESTLRRYVQARIEPGVPREVVKRLRELSVMEVDFGRLGIVYDSREKRNRVAYVFSARLRYSAFAYRDVVYDQKQDTFWECHIRAFEHFGGVPQRVVPDNLKAAVVKASFTDPVINRGYHDLANYYGFLIDPCLPYRPRHKGGVESDIKYVKKNFFAAFRMRQKRLGRGVPLADDIIPALREWEHAVANVRVIKEMGASPYALFEKESPSLRSLPAQRFDLVHWCTYTVRGNGRVVYDRSWYTVPDKYIDKQVLIAANSRKIRIFFDHELIAWHSRATKPRQDIFKKEHLGARARAYMEYTRENLLKRSQTIGKDAFALAQVLLEDHVVAKERFVHGIISLAKKYGNARVDAACKRALVFDAPRYDVVKRILAKNLDTLSETIPADSHGQYHFTFARTPGYYNSTLQTKEENS